MNRRIPLSIEVKKVLKLFTVTLIGLIALASSLYFVKMTNSAESGYQLRENQLRQKTLESENRILEQQLLKAQSLAELKQSDVVKKLAPPENQVYVKEKILKRR